MQEFEIQNIMPGNTVPGKRDTNVYPGYRNKMTVEQVRNFIKKQKRTRGQQYSLNTGDNNDLNVELSGTARVLLGLAVAVPNDDFSNAAYNGTVDLKINNEVVLDAHPIRLLSYKFIEDEYYFFPRPLSGQDDIKINVRGRTAAGDLDVVFYYL